MKDYLAIIKRVIEEHQTIREHVKLVGDSISDREALATLEKASTDWIPGRGKALSERQNRLLRTISSLEEGLKHHFAFEEKALPPLLGELLMQALILEHREIMKELVEAKSIVANTKLEGLRRDELLFQESHMQDMIHSIYQLNEGHLTKEEAILYMVQRALEEK